MLILCNLRSRKLLQFSFTYVCIIESVMPNSQVARFASLYKNDVLVNVMYVLGHECDYAVSVVISLINRQEDLFNALRAKPVVSVETCLVRGWTIPVGL